MGYINGKGKPLIKIIPANADSTNDRIEIELDQCMITEGLVENYQDVYQEVTLENNNRIRYGTAGTHIEFILDYSVCTGENALKLDQLDYYGSNPLTWKLILYPRKEILSRYFEVLIGGSWGMSLMPFRGTPKVHRNVVYKFITKLPGGKKFTDPTGITIQSPYLITF